jgi:HD-GYP domain-containing protein (c-di-GMP phosphodiesterase class II)
MLDPVLVHKPGKLDDAERLAFQQHPVLGAQLVKHFLDYRRGHDYILYHHEHYDGTGYPTGSKGRAIPLGARIISIADAFDAMTSNRAYRRALVYEEAAAELRRCQGTQFDPELVDLFLSAVGPAELDRTAGQRLKTPPLVAAPTAGAAPQLTPAAA